MTELTNELQTKLSGFVSNCQFPPKKSANFNYTNYFHMNLLISTNHLTIFKHLSILINKQNLFNKNK